MTDFVGRRSAHPQQMFKNLRDGDSLHGLTDGTWSLTAAVYHLAELTGYCDLVISTWTAASADIRKARAMLNTQRYRTIRFLVDRSFLTRQPGYCALLRDRFGDDAIRVWSAHCKFLILHSGDVDVLYLTSANLNANKRLENFSVFVGGTLPAEYLALVDDMFDAQAPSEGFDKPKVARQQMNQITRRPVITR